MSPKLIAVVFALCLTSTVAMSDEGITSRVIDSVLKAVEVGGLKCSLKDSYSFTGRSGLVTSHEITYQCSHTKKSEQDNTPGAFRTDKKLKVLIRGYFDFHTSKTVTAVESFTLE